MRTNGLIPQIIYIPLVQFRLQNVNTLTGYTPHDLPHPPYPMWQTAHGALTRTWEGKLLRLKTF